MKKWILLLLIISLKVDVGYTQEINPESIPKNYYSNPLDLKINLSATFGEIRTNHFHSGLDIKTNQREGYPVYAVADGYISRIRVQIGGFGYALYVNHPNGTTSVYAHLQKFNDKEAASLKAYQYKIKSFAVDYFLEASEIPVKKGEVIAFSGNTGGSAGPHLHFEIRNTKTEQTINPLALGIKVDDTIKPTITGLYLYTLNDEPFSEKTPKKFVQVKGSNGNYSLLQNTPITVSGRFGFGITAYDLLNGNANKNGLFSSTILLDNKVIFETVIDQFYFEHTRSVNAFIDYPTKILQGKIIEKGFALPGAKTSLYRNMMNYGLIELKDNEIHDIKYILRDYNKNETILNFKIKSINNAIPIKSPNQGMNFTYVNDNRFEKEDIIVNFPKGTFYDDIDFIYSKSAKTAHILSDIHRLHNTSTPVHSNYSLSIKLPENLLDIKDKIVIVNSNGASQGGEYINGYIKANPKILGSFYLKADEIAPTITPINITNGANLTNHSKISLKIRDNLSGIKSFNGYINGEWVLMEYEPRTATVWHTFEKSLPTGKHTFKMVVTDLKDNTKTLDIDFYK